MVQLAAGFRLKGITVNKIRVLYADNDRDFLDARSELLEMENFKVFKAHSPEEATEILERINIHVAILDIRLVDDNDEGDNSGILLAQDARFKKIPKILVTGYPTYEAVREAYSPIIQGEPIAHAFLGKGEGVDALIAAVNSAFEKVVGINWNLRIVWDKMGLLSFSYLVTLLENKIDTELLLERRDELKDLVCTLFPTEDQIAVVRLNWLRNGCVCLTLFASSKSFSQQAVLILGLWEAANVQRMGSEEYLAVDSALLPQPVFAASMRYGGVLYTFPDIGSGPLLDGSSFFNKAGNKTVRIALDDLYTKKLRDIHRREISEINNANLSTIYRDRLGILDPPEAIEETQGKIQKLAECAQFQALVKELSLDGKKMKIIFTNGQSFLGVDPLAIFFDLDAFNKQKVVISSTFGGITSTSLLINESGQVYPLDMSSIIRSPTLEDFVSIECEFHFKMINSYNLISLLDFEEQLSKTMKFDDQLLVGNVEPECRKALTAINIVRKQASEATSELFLSYLIGLFHYSIFPLLQYDPQFYLAKHQTIELIHRLMVASLIVGQIKMLRKRDKKLDVDPIRNGGFIINENNREVLVDGRKVRLTPTQFKLILHLHNTPNSLCSREEILSCVFNVKGTPTDSDKHLLYTHMDRLRKKIDINPSNHRFIVNIRGEGYLLDLSS